MIGIRWGRMAVILEGAELELSVVPGRCRPGTDLRISLRNPRRFTALLRLYIEELEIKTRAQVHSLLF